MAEIEALRKEFQAKLAVKDAEFELKFAKKDALAEYLRKLLRQHIKKGETSDEDEEESAGSVKNKRYDFVPRADIPEFEGKLDPEDFLEWLSVVERLFDLKEYPESKKVKIVALKLRKYASIW